MNKKPVVARAERPMEPRTNYGRRFLVFGIIVMILLGAVAAFARAPQFLVSDIRITGTRSLDPELVKQTAQYGISGTWLGFIPRSHVIFLRKRAWQQALLSEIPAIERTQISFDGTIVTIVITEREPQYIWCQDQILTDGCAFLDDSGMRYERAPRYSRGVFLTLFGGEVVPISQSLKTQVLDPARFMSVVATVRALRDARIVVDQVTFETDGDISYGFQSAFGSVIPVGAVVLAVPSLSPADVAHRVLLVFQEAGFARQFQETPADLRLIDVRFPGGITYRYGNSAPVSEDSSTPIQ